MLRHLFVRIFLIFLILIGIISAAVYFYAKPLLLSIANKGLHRISKESSVSDLRITRDFIEFQGLTIAKGASYVKIPEARIYYSMASIFKRKADFYIKAVNYNKLKIGDIAGKGELKGNVLYIRPVMVNFLGGSVKGEFDISLDRDMNYNLRLSSQGMEIKRLVDDMKFYDRFDMTGRLDGEFSLSGKGQGIKDIKGDFHTDNSGGMLIIKDKTFLENIARQSNQPLDIIVESFKNYNYNNGMIKLFMESGNIMLDLKLDGGAGRRSLIIILHDFKKGKETP